MPTHVNRRAFLRTTLGATGGLVAAHALPLRAHGQTAPAAVVPDAARPRCRTASRAAT